MKRLLLAKIMWLLIFTVVLFVKTTEAQGIEFDFANVTITNDGSNNYFEFDITASATSNSQFYIAQVYFDYNTNAFGSSIFNNNKIWVTKGQLLNTVSGPNSDLGAYSLIVNDNTPSKVSISNTWVKVDFSGGDEGYELSKTLGSTPQVYVHVKILIQNYGPPSNIQFDASINQIELQQYYFNTSGSSNSVNYSPVNFGAAINDPLPVELVSFTAKAISNHVELNWRTETEVNNYGFEVQRSLTTGNKNWQKIAFVNGSGNSNSPKEYKYVDTNPVGGKRFAYRLKQLDTDGKYEFSNEADVDVNIIPVEFTLFNNYPNPFNPTTNITFQLGESANIELTVYNIIGEKIVTLVNQKMSPGVHIVKFDGSSLASGNYIYVLTKNDQRIVKKMQLIK